MPASRRLTKAVIVKSTPAPKSEWFTSSKGFGMDHRDLQMIPPKRPGCLRDLKRVVSEDKRDGRTILREWGALGRAHPTWSLIDLDRLVIRGEDPRRKNNWAMLQSWSFAETDAAIIRSLLCTDLPKGSGSHTGQKVPEP